jgi:hypothetical protein
MQDTLREIRDMKIETKQRLEADSKRFALRKKVGAVGRIIGLIERTSYATRSRKSR